MEACHSGEVCSKERKQHSDIGGRVSSQALVVIETVTPVWASTAMTDAAADT